MHANYPSMITGRSHRSIRNKARIRSRSPEPVRLGLPVTREVNADYRIIHIHRPAGMGRTGVDVQ